MGHRQPKKDKRKRTWPSGTNVKGMKQIANQKARRILKEWDGVIFPFKRFFDHYDINDFK